MATKKKIASKKSDAEEGVGTGDLIEGVVGEAVSNGAAEVAGEGVTGTVVGPGGPTPSFIGHLDQVSSGLTSFIHDLRENRAARDRILSDAESAEGVVRDTLGVAGNYVTEYKITAGLIQMEQPPLKRGRGRPPGSTNKPREATAARKTRRPSDGQMTNRETIRKLAQGRRNRRFSTLEVKELFHKESRSSPGTVLYEMKQKNELKSVGRGQYEYVGT